MPGDPEVMETVHQWLGKAEKELVYASLGLRPGAENPPQTVCFSAQHSIEKYLKVLLLSRMTDSPRTQDFAELATWLGRQTPPPQTAGEQERLTNYAVEAHYPGDFEKILLAEAKKAVALARKVRLWARHRLPLAETRKMQNAREQT